MAQNILNGNGRCKICKSPFRAEIDELIIQGASSTEIIKKFPELGLNRVNIHNHKRHISSGSIEKIKLSKLCDLQELIEDLTAKLLSRTLQPSVANSIARLLALQLRIYELKDLEERISRLENIVEKIEEVKI
jgi:hypothetical protein